MTFYATWAPPERPDAMAATLVPQRMSWLVLVLGWPGLLARGAFVSGLMAGGLTLMAWAIVPHGVPLFVLLAAMHVLAGICAADILAWELRLRGLVPGPVIMATNASDARLRLVQATLQATAPFTTPSA